MSNSNIKHIERVSSTQLQRSIGRYLDESLKEPILITTHNRDTHALISIEEFREYRKPKSGARIALHVTDLSDEDFRFIMEAEIPPEHDPERGK